MSSPAVEKLNNLSNVQTIVISIVLAGLYYMMLYDDGVKLEKAIVASKAAITQSNTDLIDLAIAEEDAEKYKKAVAEMGIKLESILKYIPEKLNDFDMMEILTSEAKASGAGISDVAAQSKPGDKDAIYHEVEVNVGLEASYTQILLFLSFLTRTDKIIVLKTANLTRTAKKSIDGEALINFKGVFLGYKYNPENKGK